MSATAAPAAGRTRRRRLTLLALLLTGAGLIAVANVSVTTKQGVNFEVTIHRLPLYLKGLEFIDRHAQYRQLAQEIVRDLGSDQARVQAVFDWTQRQIRPTPDGWPVVDDHILNIIIRGHGLGEQRADVFATLLTYAGVPSFWAKVRAADPHDALILTFVRTAGRWGVVDVDNGWLFRNPSGALATAEDLAAHPEWLPATAQSLMVGATPYPRLVSQIRTPAAPRPLRAELQMPWPRLWYEVRRAVGLEHHDGFER